MVGGDELYARIGDAPWAPYKQLITVGGAGGLGSWLSFFLSRIGHSLSVYDFDAVGNENIGGGQLYGLEHIGQPKTAALKDVLKRFCGDSPYIGLSKFEKGSAVTPMTIATFDNMESRMDMYKEWVKLIQRRNGDDKNKYIWAFINISMLPEGGFIQVVDRPSRMKRWEEDWMPSADMPDLACTFKSTTHNAASVASQAVSILNNIVCNKKVTDMPPLHIPYHTRIDNKMLMLDHNE